MLGKFVAGGVGTLLLKEHAAMHVGSCKCFSLSSEVVFAKHLVQSTSMYVGALGNFSQHEH